uniref:Uncharacterized protein n=1 Tax=viral metagenome TaxID=1070528 RepID=A0A6H2A2F7_9ZZZZ
MCVHHRVIDYYDKGVCKKCGRKKDFSPPAERLTRKEIKLINTLGKNI